MKYAQYQSGRVANEVGLALTASHILSPSAGTFGNHLGVCILHTLKRGGASQYETAIRDLTVTIKEVQGTPSGDTRFKVQDADQIKSDGKSTLTALVPKWAVPLAQQTISYGVGTIHPLFSVLVNAMFDHAGGKSHEDTKAWTKLTLRDAKGWTFRRWHRKPGSLVLGIDMAYLLATIENYTSVSGSVDYEVSVAATTGKRLFSPRGRLLQPTGMIADSVSFTVNWQ